VSEGFLGVTGRLVSQVCLDACIRSHAPGDAGSHEARRALEDWRRRMAALGPTSSPRALLDVGAEPLARLLGFTSSPALELEHGSLAVGLRGPRGGAALIVTPWGARLDPLWRMAVVEAGRRGARWALLFNSTHLRLLDAGRLHARRYLEFDLDLAVDDERTFAALWATLGAHALVEASGATRAGLPDLVDASDAYAAGVCRSLRDGVLSASADVLGALVARRRTTDLAGAFDQALTVVYRMLFLLFAEARGLVPIWHPVYRDSYSIDSLRQAVQQGRAIGLWDGLRAIGKLAHAGCRAGDLVVTAFNGRLFDRARLPLAERRDLDDEAAGRAVLALTTRPAAGRDGRERLAYGELGVEQLGAVYETLLDFAPHVRAGDRPEGGARPPRGGTPAPASARRAPGARPAPDARVEVHGEASRAPRPARSVELRAGSTVRKSTGTFYTPQGIARYLVRETLGPLVRGRPPEHILALRVLDPSMGSGAFLVEACLFLSQAYEDALVAGGGCLPSDLGPRERAAIRRRIAERCLFGVDLNPMAVQLARLSLWLATLAHDRPLSFFDHHLRVGDSLVGAWLSGMRSAPRTSVTGRPPTRDEPSLFEAAEAEAALRSIVPVRFTLDEPNDSVAAVRRKEHALAGLERRDSPLTKWKQVADLWCAWWFAGREAPPTSAFQSLVDAILLERSDLPAATVGRFLDQAVAVAASHRFFHWELEFPEVFFDAGGNRLASAGFDAVIGNPPWDMVRADAGDPDERRTARADGSGLLRFAGRSGAYTARSRGQANKYQLFVERAIALLRAGGRFGLVLPSGFASDHGSDSLRRLVFSRCAVEGIVGFENRRGVFPVHRGVKFLLLTGAAGTATTRVGLRAGEVDPAALESEDAGRDGWFPVRVTPALLERLSGPGLAVPELKTPLDVAIAERAAILFPPLADRSGWGACFGRELNATDDRDVLKPHGRGVPVIEGKHIDPFRVRVADARHAVAVHDADRRLGGRHRRARLAYRDVAGATNRLTLIAAIVPAGSVSTHTVFCLRTPLARAAQHLLCGLFNSLVVNYLVRLRVTTHVTTAIVERLPVPRREDGPAACREIAALARRLGRRPSADGFARINGLVARLYRLSPEEFAHVLGTFPLIDRAERDRALAAFTELGA
jgi:hypothetical protein